MNNNLYIKADDNKIINERFIRWIRKIDECLEVCTKSDGCSYGGTSGTTHKICKLNNPTSYEKLNSEFN
jgi:hypothetical protein